MIAESTRQERRRISKKAEIVSPSHGFRMPKPVRRLQRRAPMLALQAVSELSTRLRDLTGRDLIDMNRIMERAPIGKNTNELSLPHFATARKSGHEGDPISGHDKSLHRANIVYFDTLLNGHCYVGFSPHKTPSRISRGKARRIGKARSRCGSGADCCEVGNGCQAFSSLLYFLESGLSQRFDPAGF